MSVIKNKIKCKVLELDGVDIAPKISQLTTIVGGTQPEIVAKDDILIGASGSQISVKGHIDDTSVHFKINDAIDATTVAAKSAVWSAFHTQMNKNDLSTELHNKTDSLNAKIDNVQSQLDAKVSDTVETTSTKAYSKTKVNNIQTSLTNAHTALSGEVTTVKATTQTNTNNITNLTTRVSKNESDIVNIKNDVTTLQTATTASSIETLNSNVSSLTSKVNNNLISSEKLKVHSSSIVDHTNGTNYSSGFSTFRLGSHILEMSGSNKNGSRPLIDKGEPWGIWETHFTSYTGLSNDGCFIAQNGNQTVICNAGDNGAIWWVDEDAGAASNQGFKITSSGGIEATSDIRTKTDIKTLGYADLLDKFKSVNFVQFKHKRPDGFTKERVNKYNDIHYGVIAQEIEELFPDVVVNNTFGSKENPYKGVEYSKLQMIANVVIQHQQQQIEELTKRVEALES